MRFAVSVISIFAIALVFGTFQESYHGAEFAGRLVYKSWWFMGLQLLMFMSILVATIVRLPPKRRLYGFYTIHAGLLTLFIGSFVTFVAGIDGSVELMPNSPSRKIIIDKYYLKIALVDKNKGIKFPLPESYAAVKMNGNYKDIIKVLEYIPYADISTVWKPSNMPIASADQGSTFTIFNENMSQKFTLSLNPTSDFKSSQKMGLLNVHYMPASLYTCFIKPSKSGFLLWNTQTGDCFTAEEKKLTIDKTNKGSKFLLYRYQGKLLKFFPDFSPVAVNDDLTKNSEVPLRVFSRNLFKSKPHLFIFGDRVAFYQKRNSSWIGKVFSKDKLPIIKLPWMKFQLKLNQHHIAKTPFQVPAYNKPVQSKGQIVKGAIQAVKINVYGKDYWVRSDAPLSLSNGKSEIRLSLGPKEIKLPFQITLNKFVMKKNPGTNAPASYESYITLLDSRQENQSSTKHHVYMNNPLKYDGLTFYQSSYFPIGPDQYASVFSANYDPGRPVKYAGSLLLVLGSIWHYFIRRKKKKTRKGNKNE